MDVHDHTERLIRRTIIDEDHLVTTAGNSLQHTFELTRKLREGLFLVEKWDDNGDRSIPWKGLAATLLRPLVRAV